MKQWFIMIMILLVFVWSFATCEFTSNSTNDPIDTNTEVQKDNADLQNDAQLADDKASELIDIEDTDLTDADGIEAATGDEASDKQYTFNEDGTYTLTVDGVVVEVGSYETVDGMLVLKVEYDIQDAENSGNFEDGELPEEGYINCSESTYSEVIDGVLYTNLMLRTEGTGELLDGTWVYNYEYSCFDEAGETISSDSYVMTIIIKGTEFSMFVESNYMNMYSSTEASPDDTYVDDSTDANVDDTTETDDSATDETLEDDTTTETEDPAGEETNMPTITETSVININGTIRVDADNNVYATMLEMLIDGVAVPAEAMDEEPATEDFIGTRISSELIALFMGEEENYEDYEDPTIDDGEVTDPDDGDDTTTDDTTDPSTGDDTTTDDTTGDATTGTDGTADNA